MDTVGIFKAKIGYKNKAVLSTTYCVLKRKNCATMTKTVDSSNPKENNEASIFILLSNDGVFSVNNKVLFSMSNSLFVISS